MNIRKDKNPDEELGCGKGWPKCSVLTLVAVRAWDTTFIPALAPLNAQIVKTWGERTRDNFLPHGQGAISLLLLIGERVSWL